MVDFPGFEFGRILSAVASAVLCREKIFSGAIDREEISIFESRRGAKTGCDHLALPGRVGRVIFSDPATVAELVQALD
jgi:hypothetical protein